MGAPASLHPGRRELPLAHAQWWWPAALRVAHEVLVLLTEAREEPTILDHPSRAWTRNWPVPLAQQVAIGSGTLSAADISGRFRDRGGSAIGPQTARKRSPVRIG